MSSLMILVASVFLDFSWIKQTNSG